MGRCWSGHERVLNTVWGSPPSDMHAVHAAECACDCCARGGPTCHSETRGIHRHHVTGVTGKEAHALLQTCEDRASTSLGTFWFRSRGNEALRTAFGRWTRKEGQSRVSRGWRGRETERQTLYVLLRGFRYRAALQPPNPDRPNLPFPSAHAHTERHSL